MIILHNFKTIIVSLLLISNSAHCATLEQTCYTNLNEVMKCFIQHEDKAYKYLFHKQENKTDHSIKTYILDSQKWPIEPTTTLPPQPGGIN